MIFHQGKKKSANAMQIKQTEGNQGCRIHRSYPSHDNRHPYGDRERPDSGLNLAYARPAFRTLAEQLGIVRDRAG